VAIDLFYDMAYSCIYVQYFLDFVRYFSIDKLIWQFICVSKLCLPLKSFVSIDLFDDVAYSCIYVEYFLDFVRYFL